MCQVLFIFLLSHTIFSWSKFHIPQHMPWVAASSSEFFVTAGDDWSQNIGTGYSRGLCLGMLREGEKGKITSIIQRGNEKELQWFLISLGFLWVGLNENFLASHFWQSRNHLLTQLCCCLCDLRGPCVVLPCAVNCDFSQPKCLVLYLVHCWILKHFLRVD